MPDQNAVFAGSIPAAYDRCLGPILFQPYAADLAQRLELLDENPLPHLTHRVVRSFFPGDPPAFYEVPFGYHDHAEIRPLLEAAGFHDVAIETVRKAGVISSVEDAATGLVDGNPIAVAIAERDASLLPTIREAGAREIEQEFGKGNIQVPLSATVVRAIA